MYVNLVLYIVYAVQRVQLINQLAIKPFFWRVHRVQLKSSLGERTGVILPRWCGLQFLPRLQGCWMIIPSIWEFKAMTPDWQICYTSLWSHLQINLRKTANLFDVCIGNRMTSYTYRGANRPRSSQSLGSVTSHQEQRWLNPSPWWSGGGCEVLLAVTLLLLSWMMPSPMLDAVCLGREAQVHYFSGHSACFCIVILIERIYYIAVYVHPYEYAQTLL